MKQNIEPGKAAAIIVVAAIVICGLFYMMFGRTSYGKPPPIPMSGGASSGPPPKIALPGTGAAASPTGTLAPTLPGAPGGMSPTLPGGGMAPPTPR